MKAHTGISASIFKKTEPEKTVPLVYYEGADGEEVVDWSKEFNLPGQGDPYETCGKLGFKGCLEVEKHHAKTIEVEDDEGNLVKKDLPEGGVFVKVFRHNCMRAECPVDYEKWAGKEAHIIEYRIEAWEKDETYRHHAKGKPVHFIASPPKYWFVYPISGEKASFEAMRDMAYKVLKWSGVYGGSVIFHGFRRRCRFCGHSPIPHDEDNCPKCGCVDFIWYVSPHFHCLGFGWIIHNEQKKMNRETGWIVKNLGVRKTVGGTALYQLSHAGIHKNHHTVTWFGKLDYDHFSPPEEAFHSEKCPYCDGSLRPVRPLKRPPPEEEGDYFLKSDNWIYDDMKILVFGCSLSAEFLAKPMVDGEINWDELLITSRPRDSIEVS